MSLYTQIARCIITLYRLSTFEEAHWDRGLVKQTLDLSKLLGEFITRMKHVKVVAGLDVGITENLDIYNMTAQRLQTIKDCWDAKVAADVAPPKLLTETSEEGYVEHLDDQWLKDILGMDDFQFEPYLEPL